MKKKTAPRLNPALTVPAKTITPLVLRAACEHLCAFPVLTLDIHLKPDEWIRLHMYAHQRGLTLEQAIAYLLASSEDALNPD